MTEQPEGPDLEAAHIEYLCSDLPPTTEVIRGMIKPLVWEVIAETETGDLLASGIYGIDLGATKGLYYVMINGLNVVTDGNNATLWFYTLDSAKAAANEHHAATILAALKGSDT